STVTTQSCRIARIPDGSVGGTPAAAGDSVDTNVVIIASPERDQVPDELVELSIVELHRGHEGAGLERGRVFQPGAKGFGRVLHRPRAECRAAHQMRQVRAEHAVPRRPAHAVAVDAGQRGAQLAARPRRLLLCRRGLLRRAPGPRLADRLHGYVEEHPRVLAAGIPRAL